MLLQNPEQLTKKQLMEMTGAKPYTVAYLTQTGRLRLLHAAKGKGDVNLYHPDSIQQLKTYLNRNSE